MPIPHTDSDIKLAHDAPRDAIATASAPATVQALHIGVRFTGVTIEREGVCAMWRVRQGSERSDIINISRAKDAALAWARPKGLGGEEVVHWRRRQSRAGASPVRSAPGNGSSSPEGGTGLGGAS
jgi:hypothetical protein